MVDLEYWKSKALECGFSHVGELDVNTIELRKEARDAFAVAVDGKLKMNCSIFTFAA